MIKKLLFLSAFLLLQSTAWAAISCSNLTANDSATDATSYNTASITPSADNLVILTVTSHIASGPPVEPTATGNGLTWVSMNTNTTNHSSTRRTTQFRAMGASPSTGAITIDFGAETQLAVIWAVDQCSGVDTSGTNGSGAIVQVGDSTGTGFATSQTITLSAFGSADNAAYGYMQHGTNEATTFGSGFAELSDNNLSDGGLLFGAQTQWVLNDNTVDWTWATSSRMQGVATEIKAASSRRRNGMLVIGS